MNRNVLVVGGTGFIGRAVVAQLASSYCVQKTSSKSKPGYIRLEALEYKQVLGVLTKTKPQYIVNCAGVLSNDEQAVSNVTITMNILRAVVESGITPRRIIICGSAAEYGVVKKVPVSEDSPVKPTSVYGKYKHQEATKALEFAQKHKIDVIVVRIFNPIGKNMASRFLIPALLRQLDEVKKNERSCIEISRLDSERDYLDVRDLARAIEALLGSAKLHSKIYNIGSGIATSNKTLLEVLQKMLGLKAVVARETADKPEAPVASQADISKLRKDCGWDPNISLEQTIKEIAKNANR